MSTEVLTSQLATMAMPVVERMQAFGHRAFVVLKHAANPRGRADRRGLLYIAMGLLVVQVITFALAKLYGITLNKPAKYLISAPMLWLGFTTTTKRLHDIGRSAWMIPLAITFWIVGATGVSTLIMLAAMFQLGLDPTSWTALYMAIFALPAFGGLLWLHCAPGQAGENFYGAPTDDTGFATPIRNDIIGCTARNAATS